MFTVQKTYCSDYKKKKPTSGSTLFIFSTSKLPPQNTPPSPEGRSGVPNNNHQNPPALHATCSHADLLPPKLPQHLGLQQQQQISGLQ
jgi:hypothetical protein